MPLAVRPASAADAGEVARIYVASWTTGFGARMPRIEADAARAQRWRAALAAQGYAQAVLWTLAGYPLGESFYRAAGFAPTGRLRRNATQIQYGLMLRDGA